ncbi:futalosine hydrolase [Mucilaginibacter yixingensis]|uniref:Futalosine hydrolase n=1 Tax=Mucilaginibacter yixingensis TaxID=1295612 RepID=A0A2T5JEE5_9SPHI|nr:futalosine hydrolase [Mucilaginibacter yixingensis]PTR00812.1 futalosine hydrolase [Mucilaginibacter yixingensis]
MKILIVAATQQEIAPLFELDGPETEVDALVDDVLASAGAISSDLTSVQTSVLVTGVGMTATAFALGRQLALNQYDLAINLGICGAFDRGLALGEVVEITTDIFAELGAQDDEDFISIDQLGFGESIYTAGASIPQFMGSIEDHKPRLKQVTGITVNRVHGNERTISKTADRLHPQVESMEGAAFFYACKQAGVPALQIRAVSNYVEKRNREQWQIGLAIKNLNTFANNLLKHLEALPPAVS